MAAKTDRRVDAYIAKSADFAQPILQHMRAVVHDACPAVEETIKWGFPHFMYEGILCSMAAFKAHCAFTFWKAALVLNERLAKNGAMGHLGRITKISDLPPKKVLVGWLKTAMSLNEQAVPFASRKRVPRPLAPVPADLAAALKKNERAATSFEKLRPSHRREYIEWINGAKREETRSRRLALALEQISEGKSQNWKYMR